MKGFVDPYHPVLVGACNITGATGDTPTIYSAYRGPFDNLPGKTVSLSTGTTYSIYTFKESDFADPHAATVAEVATALSAWALTISTLSATTITTTGSTAAYQHLAWVGAASGVTNIGTSADGTAHKDLGLISGMRISAPGALTGVSIVMSTADCQEADMWGNVPVVEVAALTPATWVATWSGDYPAHLTSVAWTPSATTSTALFTSDGTAFVGLIRIRF